MTLPTFVVAGAARSGTTAVIEALRGHPEVFVTNPKEPHFFAFADRTVDFQGPGDSDTINRAVVTATDRYLALYDGSEKYAARGEGSVSTLYYHDHSIGKIASVNPDLRIVLLLRDPVDRAHSSYQYLRSRGHEPVADFERALDEENSRRDANWHHLWHYVAMSRYSEQMGPFLAAFGSQQVGVWTYEQLTRDFEQVMFSIREFIGVDPQLGRNDSRARVNVSGKPRFERVHDAQLWMSRQPWLRASVKRLVPFGVRERIRGELLRPESLPASARARLTNELHDDVTQLRALTGKAFDEWNL